MKTVKVEGDLAKSIVAGSNMYIAGKVQTVREIIDTIDKEIDDEKTTSIEYRTVEGEVIPTDVGYVNEWWKEYRKLLIKRFDLKEETKE